MYGTAAVALWNDGTGFSLFSFQFFFCRQWLLILYSCTCGQDTLIRQQQMGIREQLICRQTINEWNWFDIKTIIRVCNTLSHDMRKKIEIVDMLELKRHLQFKNFRIKINSFWNSQVFNGFVKFKNYNCQDHMVY